MFDSRIFYLNDWFEIKKKDNQKEPGQTITGLIYWIGCLRSIQEYFIYTKATHIMVGRNKIHEKVCKSS